MVEDRESLKVLVIDDDPNDRQLTMRETRKELPVIMLTATGTEEVAVEAMKKGLSDYILRKRGHVRRIGITVRRVLEHSKSEQSRKLEEEKYRHLPANLQDGVILAEGGVIRHANSAAARMWGYATPEEMMGLHPWDLAAPESKNLVRDLSRSEPMPDTVLSKKPFLIDGREYQSA